jgi:hypothetical protein
MFVMPVCARVYNVTKEKAYAYLGSNSQSESEIWLSFLLSSYLNAIPTYTLLKLMSSNKVSNNEA